MTRQFISRNKELEIFFGPDGHIELYEKANPSTTGFVFDDQRDLISFINGLTDIAEQHLKEK